MPYSEIGLRSGLAGAESLERFEGGWLVSDVVEGPCCCLDLSDSRVVPFDAEAREPAQRGALEPLRLGVANRHADFEGVAEVDARQLGGGVANQGEVAGLEGPAEAGVRRSLARQRTYVRMGVERIGVLVPTRFGVATWTRVHWGATRLRPSARDDRDRDAEPAVRVLRAAVGLSSARPCAAASSGRGRRSSSGRPRLCARMSRAARRVRCREAAAAPRRSAARAPPHLTSSRFPASVRPSVVEHARSSTARTP